MSVIKRLLNLFGIKKKDPINGYLDIDGWLTPIEAKGLYEIARLVPLNAVVLEIGSWKGKSTFCIAKGLQKATINCIDPFNAAGEAESKDIYANAKGEKSLLEQFQNNLAKIRSSVKIKPLQGYSNEFVGQITNIDFLFIDGDHSIEGCRYDYDNYAQDVKLGGFLAFHDYYPDRADLGPTWVIDNLVKKDKAYTFYKSFDTLCVFKKTQ